LRSRLRRPTAQLNSVSGLPGRRVFWLCPLYPRKRTSLSVIARSALSVEPAPGVITVTEFEERQTTNGTSVKAVSLSVADPQAAQAERAECDDLRPPVWIRSVRVPFSPLWPLLPCSRKRPASVLLAPTCRHNKFPTATAFADSLAASRRTNSQLGQIVHSCIITIASSIMVRRRCEASHISGIQT
jgi:hypothetical protein